MASRARLAVSGTACFSQPLIGRGRSMSSFIEDENKTEKRGQVRDQFD